MQEVTSSNLVFSTSRRLRRQNVCSAVFCRPFFGKIVFPPLCRQKHRCAHRNLFHLTNAILTKARVAGQETFDFIGRPASASHFESRINRKCARLQTNVCSLFLYLCESRIPQTEPDSNESPQRMVRREFPDTECVKHKGRVNRIG